MTSIEGDQARTGAGRRGAVTALGIWWGSRVALFLAVTLASYVLALPGATRIGGPAGWLAERFVWWDSFHFLRIAERGYLPPGLACCDQAFFPGYPATIAALAPLVGGNAVLAGLLVTQVAASVAVVLLWRLAEVTTGDARVARAAVVLLAITPFGLFLSSVYSEALFLALSLGAWLAGTRGRWWLAGLLAGCAAAVRINGLFLAAALAVGYVADRRARGGRRPRPDALALAVPAVVVAAYFGYLHARTGSWSNWQDAQVVAWHRQTAAPWVGLAEGWRSLRTAPSNDLVLSRAADLFTTGAGLVLTAVLAWRRRWAEAVLIGLNVAVLVCSTTLVSSPRYALMWFPGYLLAARWSVRRRGRWILPAALVVAPPLLAVFSLTFSLHLWVA